MSKRTRLEQLPFSCLGNPVSRNGQAKKIGPYWQGCPVRLSFEEVTEGPGHEVFMEIMDNNASNKMSK